MIDFSNLNILAILVSSLAAMAIGFFWYGPLFGAKWINYIGMNEADKNSADIKKAMGTGFLATVIGMSFIALLLQIIGTSTVKEAAIVACVLWAATAFPSELHGVAWEKKPLGLLCINASNALVTYITGSVILQWMAA